MVKDYQDCMKIIQIGGTLVAALRETEEAVLLRVNGNQGQRAGAEAWFPKAALTLHAWEQDAGLMYYAEVMPSFRLSREQQTVVG